MKLSRADPSQLILGPHACHAPLYTIAHQLFGRQKKKVNKTLILLSGKFTDSDDSWRYVRLLCARYGISTIRLSAVVCDIIAWPTKCIADAADALGLDGE